MASIRAADADIVSLQEIGPRGALQEIVAELAIGFRTTADASAPDYAGRGGPEPVSDQGYADPSSFLSAVIAGSAMTIETPHCEVAYLNVHTKIPRIKSWRAGPLQVPLSFRSERRRDEIRTLLALIEVETRPLIVTGDFNMTERCGDYASIAHHLRDAFRAVGTGLGHTFPRFGARPRAFPVPWPMLRLDYVWHSDHFEAASAEVGDAGQSDHHPVIAGLRWSRVAAATDGRVPLAAHAVVSVAANTEGLRPVDLGGAPFMKQHVRRSVSAVAGPW